MSAKGGYWDEGGTWRYAKVRDASEELVEELARRMATLFVETLQETETTETGFPSMACYDMVSVARECVRQMEWTRRYTLDECNQPWEPPLPPLTLAPEDWKP